MFGIGIIAGMAGAQSTPQPHFEVASVKGGGDAFSTRPDRSAGRIRWTTQLCYLIGYANHLDFSRVTGKNGGSVYSVEATFDPAATDDQVRLMVQALLAERFKMRAHRASREADGYALVVGKGGLKIKEANPGAAPPAMPEWIRDASPALKAESFIAANLQDGGVVGVTGRNVSMSQLAETLQRSMKVPVWDRTGLTGNYYFAFRYALESGAGSDADAPAVATALQESLGLKLEKQKGPVETVVIDYIEEPSEN